MLLDDGAGVGAAGAGWVVADHAALVDAEHALTGSAENPGRGGERKSDGGSGTITAPNEGVAAFHTRGEDVIDQAGLEGAGGAGICAAESGKLRCVPLIREEVTTEVLITRREATAEASLARMRERM